MPRRHPASGYIRCLKGREEFCSRRRSNFRCAGTGCRRLRSEGHVRAERPSRARPARRLAGGRARRDRRVGRRVRIGKDGPRSRPSGSAARRLRSADHRGRPGHGRRHGVSAGGSTASTAQNSTRRSIPEPNDIIEPDHERRAPTPGVHRIRRGVGPTPRSGGRAQFAAEARRLPP